MNNELTPKSSRSIYDRIWYPTPNDILIVRIFFWISILVCLLLPRFHEALAQDQTWKVFSMVWLAVAVVLRIVVQIRLSSHKE